MSSRTPFIGFRLYRKWELGLGAKIDGAEITRLEDIIEVAQTRGR